MYAVVRDYDIKAGNVERVVALARDEMVPEIRKIPGFVGYTIATPSDTRLVSTSMFEDEQGCRESTRIAGEWVNRRLPEVPEGPPRVTEGKVLLREMGSSADAQFGVMRRFTLTPGQVRDGFPKVRDELVPMLKTMPGFGAYAMIDCGDGLIVSLSAYASAESAEEAGRRGAEWAEEALPDFPDPEVTRARIRIRAVNEQALTVR